MKITHVLRGDDHLANTPRQLMLLDALQLPHPLYGHLSMITGDDGAKLSKRHGSSSLHDLKVQGYLSLATLNYLARLSHAYDQLELMSFDELALHFKLEKLSRAPARFDEHQLMHWQKETVMRLSHKEILDWLGLEIVKQVPQDKLDTFAELMRQNILFPKDANKWVRILFGGELQFTQEQIAILKEAGEDFFVLAKSSLKEHGLDIKKISDAIKSKLNVSGKQLFRPLRLALTGEEHGPELQNIAGLLGAEKIQHNFDHALEIVRK